MPDKFKIHSIKKLLHFCILHVTKAQINKGEKHFAEHLVPAWHLRLLLRPPAPRPTLPHSALLAPARPTIRLPAGQPASIIFSLFCKKMSLKYHVTNL